jgi:hypothetical protein
VAAISLASRSLQRRCSRTTLAIGILDAPAWLPSGVLLTSPAFVLNRAAVDCAV